MTIGEATSALVERLKSEKRTLKRKNDILKEALGVARDMMDELKHTNRELWQANVKLQEYIKNNFAEEQKDASN